MPLEHDTERLSAYMDGDLPPAEVERLVAHLEGCAGCRDVLADLRAVVREARALPDPEPPELWPGISGRLRPRSSGNDAAPDERRAGIVPIASRLRRHRVTLTVPQLVAAGLALMVLPAAALWWSAPGSRSGADTVAVAAGTDGPVAAVLASYQEVIGPLEREFEDRREALDPGTVLVVERNLAIIDQAITEARLALEADPSSGFLSSHLASAMRRKVDLLRQVTRIGRTET